KFAAWERNRRSVRRTANRAGRRIAAATSSSRESSVGRKCNGPPDHRSSGPFTLPSHQLTQLPTSPSEDEFDADLQLAHRLARAADRPVERVGQRRVRIVPDRIVQHVEPLEPELQRLARDPEVPDDRRVEAGDAWTVERVAAGVAERAEVVQGIGAGVEPALN